MKIERILDRKKALRMCVKKLKKISDPESKLCKAVLINNTLQSLKNCDDIRLQNENKDVGAVMNCSKIEPKPRKNSNFSPEDILSEIVLPPPLVPHMENFTCKSYKDWSEHGEQVMAERFREPRGLTVTDAFNDKICDNNLTESCVNNSPVNSAHHCTDNSYHNLLNNRQTNFYDNRLQNLSDNIVHNFPDKSVLDFADNGAHKLLDNRTFADQKSLRYFSQNFRAKVRSDAEPPADITLEEIDSSNGLCADFSLYNSFTTEQSSDNCAISEQESNRISQSEQNMLTNEHNFYMNCEQNFSNISEQYKPSDDQNSYRSEQNKLTNMISLSYRQQ